jgi:hypothetical protein
MRVMSSCGSTPAHSEYAGPYLTTYSCIGLGESEMQGSCIFAHHHGDTHPENQSLQTRMWPCGDLHSLRPCAGMDDPMVAHTQVTSLTK